MALEKGTTYAIKILKHCNKEWIKIFERERILLNEYALQLLNSTHCNVANEREVESLIVLSVKSLGFQKGATLSKMIERGKKRGLKPCSLTVALSFRVIFDEEQSETEMTSGKAPTGSITVISASSSDTPEFPKGFYLRKIHGEKWLRGFSCSDDYEFNLEDRVAFCVANEIE
ncbi:MAG: hypothetical protein NTX05_07265 [Fusobacteria bacterium]|nr:hypothetical protein [Fusobacteriota bacterium]